VATEAAYRMLQNNLDAEVAENPQSLVVYGGIGRAARDWASYDRILEVLRELRDDQTLLVQSGKPVGVFPTHPDAPRVLIANSNLVPHWATWEHFNALDRQGLMMYGQMTAGSWIYIGSQGIVQGTYETFRRDGSPALRRSPDGQLDPHRGPGRHGRRAAARRLARRRLLAQHRVPASRASTCASRRATWTSRRTTSTRRSRASPNIAPPARGVGRAARQRGRSAARARAPRRAPDAVTDQTSAHDPLHGYLPAGLVAAGLGGRAGIDPDAWCARRRRACARTWRRCSPSPTRACRPSTTATTCGQMAQDAGCARAFDFPGFVPAYVRPLFCRGIGPFRWVALSGRSEDIRKTDAKVKELIPDDPHLHRWLDMAGERIAFQGLPRASAGSASATVTGSRWPSTRWSRAASCRRRS
jgi:urocanate hydratase